MRKSYRGKKLIASVLLGAIFTGIPSAFAAQQAEEDNAVRESASYPTLEETIARMREARMQESAVGNVPSESQKGKEERTLTKKEEKELDTLKSEFYSMSETQASILALLDRLSERLDTMQLANTKAQLAVPGPTSANLVNPAPAARANYTQDAINAQGNSTMTFAYAPNQMYKIYCRRGYITDLAFKKGEQITYIGGGDTSGWAVSKTTVDGAAHLFIKPVVETSTTNLVVATDKRSYHIILNSSDWYNPMVTWSYGAEDVLEAGIRQAKEDALRTATVNTTDIENLDHNYRVNGNNDAYKPVAVYSDGQRTCLEYSSIPKKQVPLFIQQKGERTMTIVSYRQRKNLYIVDAVFEKAQLRVSENETVTIEHKK